MISMTNRTSCLSRSANTSSLFTEEALNYAASKLPNDSSAVLFLWENLWLENLRKAVLDSKGVMIERGQIPAELVEQIREGLASQA